MQCCSTDLSRIALKITAKLFLVISIMEGDHPFFRFETDFFPASFRLDINKTIIMKLFVRKKTVDYLIGWWYS